MAIAKLDESQLPHTHFTRTFLAAYPCPQSAIRVKYYAIDWTEYEHNRCSQNTNPALPYGYAVACLRISAPTPIIITQYWRSNRWRRNREKLGHSRVQEVEGQHLKNRKSESSQHQRLQQRLPIGDTNQITNVPRTRSAIARSLDLRSDTGKRSACALHLLQGKPYLLTANTMDLVVPCLKCAV